MYQGKQVEVRLQRGVHVNALGYIRNTILLK
jgi:hypothetical protein